jgi:uncharacterized protein (TIGR00730 family)
MQLKRIAIFCGSASGTNPAFADAAAQLATTLAERHIGIVYGGANVGLMQIVADRALAAGGKVVGVLPQGLADRELAHPSLTRLEIVHSMHERKARMAALSDAVIALPGGYGTLDELFEAITWSQLGIDPKPIGLLDVDGFWQPLLTTLDAMVTDGFIKPVNRDLLVSASTVPVLLDLLQHEAVARAGAPRASVRP